VKGAGVVCGTKRQHSGGMDDGVDSQQKQARVETNAEDMDLDESGLFIVVRIIYRRHILCWNYYYQPFLLKRNIYK